MKTKITTCHSVPSIMMKRAIASRRKRAAYLRVGLAVGVFILMGMLTALIAAIHPSESASVDNKTNKDSKRKTAAMATYSKLPIAFEPNRGQSDKNVRFLAHAPGGLFYFCSDEIVVSLRKTAGFNSRSGELAVPPQGRATTPRDIVRMHFMEPNARPTMQGQELLPGKINYLLGNDSASWHTDLPTYAAISYHELYPGTTLTYKGTGGQLEGTYTIEPGGDPSRIRWRYDETETISVDSAGNLLVSFPGRDGNEGVTVTERTPVAWQEVGGRQQFRKVKYAVAPDKSIGFCVETYDLEHRLIIDPVLSYSTYFGGTENDFGNSVAVDPKGYAYITGYTESSDFPTVNPLQAVSGGVDDAFVTKFSPDGSEVIYSTYLGGSGQDIGHGIAVDDRGHAYITGETSSTDFPLAHPFQTIGGDGGFGFVAFVSKLRSNGSRLLFSTYLGGTGGFDTGYAIAVDDARNTYVTGQTLSSDFPTLHPIQPANGGATDAFVTKFTPRGSRLVYSTYLGGSNFDYGLGIAVKPGGGGAYITGYTASGDFPTANPLDATLDGFYDTFVTKLNRAGSALKYSTFLGGSGADFGSAVAVDAIGNAYITGITESIDFPTVNPIQAENAGSQDVFITKINPAGEGLVYSTYLGGSGLDRAFGIALNRAGEAYIAGDTFSTDFPVVDPIQAEAGGGGDDAILAKVNAAGSALVYSTYLGGTGTFEMAFGIAIDRFGSAYIAGTTNSPDFPNTRPGIRPPGPDTEPFIAKISESAAQPLP